MIYSRSLWFKVLMFSEIVFVFIRKYYRPVTNRGNSACRGISLNSFAKRGWGCNLMVLVIYGHTTFPELAHWQANTFSLFLQENILYIFITLVFSLSVTTSAWFGLLWNLGTLSMRQEYTSDGTPVHHRSAYTCTHSHPGAIHLKQSTDWHVLGSYGTKPMLTQGEHVQKHSTDSNLSLGLKPGTLEL